MCCVRAWRAPWPQISPACSCPPSEISPQPGYSLCLRQRCFPGCCLRSSALLPVDDSPYFAFLSGARPKRAPLFCLQSDRSQPNRQLWVTLWPLFLRAYPAQKASFCTIHATVFRSLDARILLNRRRLSPFYSFTAGVGGG